MNAPDLDEVLVRLAIDVVAIAVLAYGIYYRRHRRRDVFVVATTFNVGLFVALVVISSGDVSVGVGFGLFAVLSIVRLRSEPYSNTELAYFFLALVLALIAGIDFGDLGLALLLTAVVLVAALVIDHPRMLQGSRRIELTLEAIPADDEAMLREVEGRLHAPVLDLRVLEIDYVRETARVAVRCATAPLDRARPRRQDRRDAAAPRR